MEDPWNALEDHYVQTYGSMTETKSRFSYIIQTTTVDNLAEKELSHQ